MWWQDFKTHIPHYLVLFLILGLGFLGFWYFSYQERAQQVIVLAVAAFYVLWGVAHHTLEENLNLKIVVEYTTVAALAATLLLIMMSISS